METQSGASGASEPSSYGGAMGSGSGSGSGGGYGVASSGPQVVTAEDLTKKSPTTAQDVASVPLTLSDQIAANFAALSSLLGTQDSGSFGGAVPVAVPSQVATKSSSTLWIFLLIGAGVIAYILLHKKEE